ncbi:MAG TPA: choice-of-anchor D domain-containing protein [Vicinamibacterales bacterium]|nr:choice-of-anchor D domain-containing protein [Vicinamibacterales bacterium]
MTALILVAAGPVAGRAQQPLPVATFHGIGDLAGGPDVSAVRDATKVEGVIYAVGASASNGQVLCTAPNNPAGCVNSYYTNAAVLWTWDGSSAALTALPLAMQSSAAGSVTAAAISSNARFIASQGRYLVSGTSGSTTVTVERAQATRFDRTTSETLDLNVNPVNMSTNQSGITAPSNSAAVALSGDGTVLYGTVALGDARNGSLFNRAARFDAATGSNQLIPLLNGTDTSNQVVTRGASTDGSVMLGTSGTAAGARAFVYTYDDRSQSGSLTAIPLLPGGTRNAGQALSPLGDLALVSGDSTLFPNRELYVYNLATRAVLPLGSPNTAWTNTNVSGMSSDGTVVATTFQAPPPPLGPSPDRTAYIHNANGWFHLATVLAAGDIHLPNLGWEQLQVNGMSPDATLVFGSGLHNGIAEGFVAEFAAGFLASFNVPAAPPADSAMTGAWLFKESALDPNPAIVMFQADGTYFEVEANVSAPGSANGFERGFFTLAADGAMTISTVQDMNGNAGLSGANGGSGMTASVSGDVLTLGFPDESFQLTRIGGGTGSIAGGWFSGHALVDNSSVAFAFLDDGTYYMLQDGDSGAAGGNPYGHDGIEKGTYSFDTVSHSLTWLTTFDTNGQWGLNAVPGLPATGGPMTFSESTDGLSATAADGSEFVRIIDPLRVVPTVTGGYTVTGAVGMAFNHAVTATHGRYFEASGLPAGLVIDNTGLIAGTPTAAGAFTVTVTATNTFLASGHADVTLVIAPPVASLSSSSLTFGNQIAGTISAPQSVTLSNSGAGVLAVSSVSIEGANPADFAQVNACGSVLPGATCSIMVTFAPTNIGTRTATLMITDNAADSPRAIVLTGTGKSGQIKATPDPLTFALQTVGTTSVAQAIVIKNTGVTTVTGLVVTASSEFAVNSSTCSATLAAATSCTVNVTFTPASGGVRSGLLTVSSSAGTMSAILSGTGSSTSLTPASLSFGNQTVATSSSPRTVTLSVVSGPGITLPSLQFSGPDAADFSLGTATCFGPSSGFTSCEIRVVFRPSKKGPRSANLGIADSTGASHSVALTGFGK